jgi:hypothetical protein
VISKRWIWLLALLFFCKVLLLAYSISPLWNVFDEMGHFAYAREVIEKRNIPVLNKSVIDNDIINHVHGKINQATKWNYIAQHPPLYYFGAGAVWKIATYLTNDPEWLFKAPRIMSALAGALTLVVLYSLLVMLTGDRLVGLGIASCIGCIPMFSQLSSCTNNDTTVTLLASLAVYFWVRYLREKKVRDAYIMAIWLSLACGTKMTALLLVPPMLVIVMFELSTPWVLRIRHIILISGISIFIPVLWTLRSYLHVGDPFVIAGGLKPSSIKVADSFIDFISKADVLDAIYVHFWGLFGLIEKLSEIQLERIGGWPLAFYSWAVLLVMLMMLLVMVWRFFVMKRSVSPVNESSTPKSLIQCWYHRIGGSRTPFVISWVLLFLAVLLAVYVHKFLYSPSGGEVRLLFFAGSAFVLCAALVVFLKSLDVDERIVCYSLLIIAFFVSIFLCKLYWIYLGAGWARALHGRYFFPLIPLMLVAAFIPLIRWLKLPSWVPVVFAIAFAIAEMAAILEQVIPLWKNV